MHLHLTNHSLLLQRKLGSGSFGSVWEAEHAETSVVVATKLLRPKRNVEKLFHNEVLNHTACCKHRNILDLYGAEKGSVPLEGSYFVISLEYSPFGVSQCSQPCASADLQADPYRLPKELVYVKIGPAVGV
jgi:serine/threonine protein kinase